MRAFLGHLKLHAFYLMALSLWGGILVVIKWWILFDLVTCALLALAALVMRMQQTARRRSREAPETAGMAKSSTRNAFGDFDFKSAARNTCSMQGTLD